MGHGHLERAHLAWARRAYLGAGFTIKPLHEDFIGAMRAAGPGERQDRGEVKNNAPLWVA